MSLGGKRGKGQSLDESKLDVNKLVGEHGLEKPSLFGGLNPEGTLDTLSEYYKHDSIHVLLKDYLGKSSGQIDKLSGTFGKGPSIAEELFVEVVQSIIKSKPEGAFSSGSGRSEVSRLLSNPEIRGKLVGRIENFKEYFNQLDEKSPLYVNRNRVSNGVLRIVRQAAERPDFYQLLNTILYAHNNLRGVLEDKIER